MHETIFVHANGIRFEVLTAGSGNRLALCLHGFPECAYSWRYQIPLLAELGFRVWAPNLRGYGGSDSPQNISAYRLSTLVEDVAGLIRASGARETLLLAHDWGAALAWALAMKDPQLIDRLVILNLPHPACFRREWKKPKQFLKSWYMLFFQIPALPEWLLRHAFRDGPRNFFRRTSPHPQRFSDEALAVYRANALRPGGLTAMLNWYRALPRSRDAERYSAPDAPVIDIPTLFLWGDRDVALSIDTTKGTDRYVSHLTFRVFSGISHWIGQEAPEAVNAMLAAWLAGRRVPEYAEIMQNTI